MNAPPPSAAAHEIEMFYDGDCPLCLREVNMLRRMDRGGRILFTDIAAPDFAAESVGKTQDELMAKMHGRLPDGMWLTGVEVFRRVYALIGFGKLVWLSRLPVLSQLADVGYWFFAANRLKLTGRCKPDGTCKVPGKTGEVKAG